MARGVDGRGTFVDDRDRRMFLTALMELKKETRFALFAYCLMGNHFHLAIKIGQIPLSRILQRLLTRYAMTFNNCHARMGHLFQARYKAILCVDDAYLLRLITYIHDNPVRSGLVAKAEDWEWSSHGAYSQKHPTSLVNPDDLPQTLGLDDDIQVPSDDFDPWPLAGKTQPALLRNAATDAAPLDSIATSIAGSAGLNMDTLRSWSRNPVTLQAKQDFITNSLQKGHTLAAISHWLGRSPASIHYFAYRRLR